MLIDNNLVAEAKTQQVGQKVNQLRQQNREVISLGLGESELDTPEHIKRAAKEAIDAGFTRYSAGQGLPELRESVSRKLKEENGIQARPENILITPGAKNALFIACATLVRPGDEIINLTPCWVANNPVLHVAEPQAVVCNVAMEPPPRSAWIRRRFSHR